jgi:hypothetical protein
MEAAHTLVPGQYPPHDYAAHDGRAQPQGIDEDGVDVEKSKVAKKDYAAHGCERSGEEDAQYGEVVTVEDTSKAPGGGKSSLLQHVSESHAEEKRHH